MKRREFATACSPQISIFLNLFFLFLRCISSLNADDLIPRVEPKFHQIQRQLNISLSEARASENDKDRQYITELETGENYFLCYEKKNRVRQK